MVILLIAIGVGANVLIFTCIDTLLRRPLPVRSPDRLVRFLLNRPNNIPNTTFPYLYRKLLQTRSRSLETVFVEEPLEMSFEAGGRNENVLAQLVSGNHDAALGIQPQLGRLLDDADENDPNRQSVVISHIFWTRAFAGRHDVIGQTIRLRGLPYTIVGVLPQGFNGMQVDDAIDVELPISALLRWIKGPRIDFAPAEVYARLKPRFTLEQARAEFASLYPELIEAEISLTPNSPPDQTAATRNAAAAHKPWVEEAGGGVSKLRTQFSLALQVLMAAVGLLLLLICTNVGGLMLGRSEARRRELGIRRSLGAPASSIVLLALGEALLLSLAGFVGALILARTAAPWLLQHLPGTRPLALNLTPGLSSSRRPPACSLPSPWHFSPPSGHSASISPP